MCVETAPWLALWQAASLSAFVPGCQLPDAPGLWIGSSALPAKLKLLLHTQGKGGKNRRRGKNDSESKRELTFKEDGQGGLL